MDFALGGVAVTDSGGDDEVSGIVVGRFEGEQLAFGGEEGANAERAVKREKFEEGCWDQGYQQPEEEIGHGVILREGAVMLRAWRFDFLGRLDFSACAEYCLS